MGYIIGELFACAAVLLIATVLLPLAILGSGVTSIQDAWAARKRRVAYKNLNMF